MPTPTVTVEMKLAGVSGGWTDVSADVLADLACTYGITGGGPGDRVASSGTLRFQLDNSTGNSAAKLGYYSIGHTNCRTGFDLGVICRLSLAYGGTTYYKFLGAIDSVTPETGKYRGRRVSVVATDAIDAFANFKLWGLTARQNYSSSDLVKLLIDDVTNTYWTLGTSLLGTSTRLARTAGVGSLNVNALVGARAIANGQDTYALALDNTDDRSSTTLSELARICASELGYAYMRGDTTQGGTFVFESRASRAGLASSGTFADSMVAMASGRARKDVLNHVQVSVTSREVGTTTETLYALESVPSIQTGQTVTFLGPYRDPNESRNKIGGLNVIDSIATTDYLMNASSDGSGADLTSSQTVVTYAGSNGVRWDITNNSGQTAYVTKLQVRGTAIRFTPVVAEAENTSSQNTYGDHTYSLAMPYQNDAGKAAGAASYLLNLYATSGTQQQAISVVGNTSAALLTQVLAREPGDRIDVTETVSGVTAWPFCIQSVALDIKGAGRLVSATWSLAPLDTSAVWQLGSSTLGVTTRLAYL